MVFASFLPVSMYKDGNHAIPGNTFTDVPDWIADPAYTGTTLDGTTGLVVASNKTGATITGSVRIQNGSAISRTYRTQLLYNGAIIATHASVSVSAGKTQTFTLQVTQDVTAGAIIKLQAAASSSAGASLLGGADSYVRVT
ncbi:hypothetical protein SAMN05421776_11744 [Nocardia farcinica]|uniref:Uncharacterized protein n=1 Tax=Nocardia farcinica TaxID=37329 RepID=A0A0H5NVS6_NOCFR|nr:hypothetical protein DXT66_14105 [Nocardia farcinica]PFW99051.1 hypothetical protein CJ469_05651 [Nocardia farcinica]PFX06089.1 hypothetical protein CJ468_04949 [Nocardia farcinica]CRY79810.1 Uncharacterised protein [Nocardia farcinica]CRY79900.1 Uncharacterised protein [Nocardia farcinica]